jgi:hypothetical protein
MKKIIYIGIIIGLSHISIHAQNWISNPSIYSALQINQFNTKKSEGNIGYTLGVNASQPLSKLLSISYGIGITHKNLRYSKSKPYTISDYSSYWVTIPIQGHLWVSKNSTLYIGGYYNIHIHTKKRDRETIKNTFLELANSNITSYKEKSNTSVNTHNQYGITFGASTKVTKQGTLLLDYQLGLKNVYGLNKDSTLSLTYSHKF